MCALAPFPLPINLTLSTKNNETLDSVPQAAWLRSLTTMPASATGGRRLIACFHLFHHCFHLQIKWYIMNFLFEDIHMHVINMNMQLIHLIIQYLLLQKKVSIPATVSEAVERLVRKKEELLLRISQQGGIKRCSDGRCSSSATVSINRLGGDSEVVIQITLRKDRVQKTQLSEILHILD